MDYILSCIELLRSATDCPRLTERSSFELRADKTTCAKSDLEDHLFMNGVTIPNLLETSIYFMVLDSYIESMNPSLEGLSFRKKYESLPQANNEEVIISQVYRILKIFRNVMVHSMHSITRTQSGFHISYVNNNTNFKLEVSFKGIKYIKGFILSYLLQQNLAYSQKYNEYYYNAFYQDILHEIIDFSDEDGQLKKVNPSLTIYRFMRCDCNSIPFSISDDNIVFDIPDEYTDSTKYPIDINIEYQNTKYIIPAEILNNKSLNINELDEWKIKS
jgi:hypothetical protein